MFIFEIFDYFSRWFLLCFYIYFIIIFRIYCHDNKSVSMQFFGIYPILIKPQNGWFRGFHSRNELVDFGHFVALLIWPKFQKIASKCKSKKIRCSCKVWRQKSVKITLFIHRIKSAISCKFWRWKLQIYLKFSLLKFDNTHEPRWATVHT